MHLSAKLGLGALALFAASCGIVAGAAAWDRWRSPPPSVLPLQARDLEGRLRVSWDTTPDYIQKATGATLEVLDGGRVQRYPVDPRVVQSGTLDYIRQTEDVVLTLTLHSRGRSGPQGVVRTVSGPPPAKVEAGAEPAVQRPRPTSGRNRRAPSRRR